MTFIGWHDIHREPYRVLFPLGTMFGCLGVSHWLFYATGITGSASAFYHASIQLGAYLYCFIVGFLWTALPRMASAAPASSRELLTVLGLLGAQVILLIVRQNILAQLCFAGLLIVLVAFAARRFAGRRSSGQVPTEFIWIPIGVLFGLVGSSLLAISAVMSMPAWIMSSARVMAQQGFVLSVVVGVAGFMAPRLMGRAPAAMVQAGLTTEQMRRVRQRRVAMHLLAAGALGVSFVIEGRGWIQTAYALRAAVATVELGRNAQWWRPPALADFYVRLLWLSLWFIVGGLWAVACWPTYRIAMLHLVLIGGFSLMSFAVGTMVVLSHAGEPTALHKPLWVLQLTAVGVVGATIARILADLWPMHYFTLLTVAASLWLIAGISWLLFIVPRVLRPIPEGAFERMHEQAKQQLLRERQTLS